MTGPLGGRETRVPVPPTWTVASAIVVVALVLLVVAGGHPTAAQNASADFGDAPDPTYPSTAGSNGAHHTNATLTHLGADVSMESDAQLTNQDTHDDGVTWVDPDTIQVDVTSAFGNHDVFLNVLFDRGSDGSWAQSGDLVVQNAAATTDGAGSATYTLDVPSRCNYANGSTYMRVTLTARSLANYTGTGSFGEGETEDYEITGQGCTNATGQGADVSVAKAANRSRVPSGERITYSLDVTNDGGNATTVEVEDDLPACMQYVSSSGPGTYDPGTNTWTVQVAAGGSARLDLTVGVQCSPGFVTNNATILNHANDPDPSDNHGDMTVQVTEPPASADLALDKQANRASVNSGGQVVYTLVVTNDGPDAARATVEDNLPPCVSVDSTSGTGTYSGGVWTVDLSPGESAGFDLVTTVNCPAGAPVENVANATGNVTDPDTSDNDARAEVTVESSGADVAVDKQVNVSTVRQGDRVEYTLTVTNNGPNTAFGVDVDEALPACMTVESTNGPGTFYPAKQTWTLMNLAPGQTAVMEIVVTVACGPGTHPNVASATVGGEEPDPNYANNKDDADVWVEQPLQADLRLNKTANVSRPRQGARVEYILVVTNAGPDDASSVVVDDGLPACMTVESTSGAGTYDPSAHTWSLSLSDGQKETLELVVTADCPGGTVTNVANVTSATTDPAPGDNRANASVRVYAPSPRLVDFGDAGDPPYATGMASFGPIHSPARVGPIRRVPYLGQNVSYERFPNVVNDDEYDDGIVEAESTYDNITVRVVNDPSVSNQETVYVNLFVDLNGDGDWQDAGEWPVRDRAVSVNGATTVDLPTTSPVVAYLRGWTDGGYTRLMLTPGKLDVSGNPRGGNQHLGETEDYTQAEMTSMVTAASTPGFTAVQVLAAVALLVVVVFLRRR